MPVGIVGEAFVRRYARGRSPIGMQVALRPANSPPDGKPLVLQIVGVTRQVKVRPDEAQEPVLIYAPAGPVPDRRRLSPRAIEVR